MPLTVLIPIALIGACVAVVTYIVFDRLWPQPPEEVIDLTHKTSPSRSAVGRIGSSGSVRTYSRK